MGFTLVKKVFLVGLLLFYISGANSGLLGGVGNLLSGVTSEVVGATSRLVTGVASTVGGAASGVADTVSGLITPASLEGPGSTCWYLRKFGYDCETHIITTPDGYILPMFRVLCPKANIKETSSKPVAFLMHGFLCSSSIWTLTPENSLAMTLCDSGYDVWLGNARGNEYGNSHVEYITLGPIGINFYKFSWAEIAAIDLPTMMNYTLAQTGKDKLTYVGHSQGTTSFFAFASSFPELAASLIKSAHLLSPVVFMDNIQGIVPDLAAPLIGYADPLSDLIEVQFLPKVFLSNLIGKTLCKDTDLTQEICQDLFEVLFGESDIMNRTVLPDVYRVFPVGSSLRQFKHYMQEKNSRKFAKYDFGSSLNQKKYGSAQPPDYPLGDITVPSFLYYADRDTLAQVVDVQKLLGRLNPNIVKAARFFPNYNHFDFLYVNNAKRDFYPIVLEDIKSV